MFKHNIIGFISERKINGINWYCVLQNQVYYVSYVSAIHSPIYSGNTEEEAYSKIKG